MQYLFVAKMVGTEAASKSLARVEALKAWEVGWREAGVIEEAYFYAAGRGGFAIFDVESPAQLFEVTSTWPLMDIAEVETYAMTAFKPSLDRAIAVAKEAVASA